ncbi:MAG: metallophosphoesterase [Oscillospiraceae bacterium]|nr:metallophosphoesterase [Oscillospiraceae bacterium]
MLKRVTAFVLLGVMLLTLMPIQAQAASAFVGYPSVFVTEDNYRISFLTNTNGMAWVEIGGVAYEDTTCGIMDWETKFHGITVPQSVLNAAKSYTICFRPLASRPANNPAPGTKETKTYTFNPVLPGEDPTLLCVSDQHNNNSGAVAVSKYAAFDALVFGGDYTGHVSTEALAQDFLKYSGEISKGTRPVIYPRGNHEIRGQYTHWIDEVMPTSETGKSYYEFVMGDLYGIVLDCGGSYTDNYTDIADTIDFEPYRVEQTRWLEKVYAKGTWKQYDKRVIFSHVPFITQSSFTDVYTDWTTILNKMDMSLLVSGHTHNFTFYSTTHGSVKTSPNFPAFTMTAYKKDPYSYTGGFLTLGDQSFTLKQVDSASLAVKSTHTITNKTYGIATEPVTEFVTAKADLLAPVVSTGSASVPSVSSPFSAHPTVFIVEDNYEISFLTTGNGMGWVEVGGKKYKDSTMGVMDWESRIHKVTIPQSVLNRAKSYKICFQSMTERAAYTPVHGSTVSRTYPFTPAPAAPTYLFMSEQLNDNTNALKVAKYKAWDVFVCGGKYMKAANTENNRYYLLTLCGETTQGTKPTIFTRGNRELRGFGAHDVIDSMGTSSTGDAFFYFTQPNIFGIVLDTGEFGADSLAQFGDTVRFQKYREKQTQWLKQIYAEGKWKDYPTRVVICHLPFTAYTDGTMKAVFKEWTDILNQMGVTLMVAGHVNNYSYYAPGDSRNVSNPNFPMLTMSDLDNGSYAYSGTYVTFKGKSFEMQNVTNTLAVRDSRTVANPLYSEETDLISNYAPIKDEKVLYFGFGNTLEDQQRYSENPVYGKTNYDKAGTIQTVNFYKGSGGPYVLPTGTGMGVDNIEGTVYSNLTGPYVKESTSTRNVTRRFVFGEPGGVTAAVGTLKYAPAQAEVLQVRFKLHNLKVRSDIDTLDPGARARIVSLQYYKDSDTAATRNGAKYGGSYVNDDYMVVTLDLDNTFRSASVITKILVEFHGFVLKDESAEGSVTLDYVYIGPKATMPSKDESYLFMDFTDSAAAQYRYAGSTYGGTNYDLPGNWRYNTSRSTAPAISGGAMSYGILSLGAPWFETQKTGLKSNLTMNYDPAKAEVVQLRVKYKDVGPLSGTSPGNLTVLFGDAAAAEPVTYSKSVALSAADVAENDKWFIYVIPLDGLLNNVPKITGIRLSFGNLAGIGNNGSVTLDYIYVGPEDQMPIPHTYEETVTAPTCTENGASLFTCTGCGKSYEEVLPATGHKEVATPAHEPTCTVAGLTEGRHCENCGLVFLAQEEIPATGHSYTYTPADAMNHAVGCELCEYAATEPHVYKDGTCICGETEIKEPVVDQALVIKHSLNLASDISINYAVAATQLADYNSFYLSCVLPVYEGNTYKGSSTVEIQPELKGSYYYFTLTGLTAVQIGDSIEATLHMEKDGRSYLSNTDTYSVASYAYAQLNKTDVDASLKSLCAELLRYGSKAQIFKSYRTDALADAALTAEQAACLSDLNAVTFGDHNQDLGELAAPSVAWVGKSLDLNSKVTIKYVFKLNGYAGDPTALSLRVSYLDVNGQTVEKTLEGAALYRPDQNWYAFDLDCLLAAELRSVVHAAVYNGDTQVSTTMVYSADTYANNKEGDLLSLCKALFAYSDSAKAFFKK